MPELMERLFDDAPESPGGVLRRMLDERSWTHAQLAEFIGRPRPAVTEIVTDKRGVSPEMAVALAAAFGTSADYWLRIEAAYRLSQVVTDSGHDEIPRRIK